MAGRGRRPKEDRINTHALQRGDIKEANSDAWAGDVPTPPDGLMQASEDAWATWFAAWFSAHWTEHDLPGIRTMIRLYDQVERGEFGRAGELRLQMDTYGVTPKGQQDRRWKPPPESVIPTAVVDGGARRYDKLRAV